MHFDIFTLFPEFFGGPLDSSILKRAREGGVLRVDVHDIRNWAEGRHRVCDDYPYGGGAGMVLKAEPVAAAIEDVVNCKAGQQEAAEKSSCPVILMSPQGRPFSQNIAEELSQHERLALLCGHYEGIDERAVDAFVTDEISIGDYVLSGGETAALVIIDAVARMVPGVLGNDQSAAHDTFSDGLLEAPQYTRPANWRGREVPDVLLSGHHGEIEKWRFRQSLQRTRARRPDLWEIALARKDWPKDKKKIIEGARHEARGAGGDVSKTPNPEPRTPNLKKEQS